METLTLEAETGRLLNLVINSLYTEREIFLRELVSNASDALDRRRVEALANTELWSVDEALGIEILADPVARTLTIRDNGIGMSRQEVVSHIGTIARSGANEFLARHGQTQADGELLGQIGQFGVGFYSSFMVADKVTVLTRRAGEMSGTRWESTGTVEYRLGDESGLPVGTSVVLQLKPADTDAGIEDYTDQWVISRIVKRYVDHVTYPISYIGSSQVCEPAETAGDQAAIRVVLNSTKPIWTRSAAEVADDEFDEFYRHLTHDWSAPLLRMSFNAEGRWNYSALLFVPTHAPHDLYYHAARTGLQLYAGCTKVAENCQELLPRYLRFLRGVVDSADLPLNVSRQTLQNAHHLTAIAKWLTRKVVDRLNKLSDSDPEKYLTVWREFGRAIKEGVSEDADNRVRLAPLLRFLSSAHETEVTSLEDYVARMKPGQNEIYYIAAESRAVAEGSPHLEQFRERGYEVLFFIEPVDELMIRAMPAYEERSFRSVANGDVSFGDSPDDGAASTDNAEFEELLTFLCKTLENEVRNVKLSRRLTSSPACLTGSEFDYSPHIQRVLSATLPRQQRTLEINPRHLVVKQLLRRHRRDQTDPLVTASAEILYGGALLAEGSPLADAARFGKRLADLLETSLALGGPTEQTHDRSSSAKAL